MKYLTLITILWSLLNANISAQNTQYAGDPLQLGAGARALGLGGAFVALSDDATAFYWNPAGLARPQKREAHAQHTEQFGGSINHDIIALRFPIRKGGLGIGLVRLGVDDIALTTLEDPNRPLGPDNRPTLSQSVGTTDNALYLSYAHRINPTFMLGITTKFIHRDLNIGTGSGFGIDLGIIYRHKRRLTFGLTIRDITKTHIRFEGGKSDTISPHLLLGASYVYDISQKNRLLSSLDLHLNNSTSGIDNNALLSLGIEYRFQEKLMLRLGRHKTHYAAGAGIKLARASIDIAILENNQLDNTYRVSTSIYF